MRYPFVIEIHMPVERLSPIAAAALGAVAAISWVALASAAYWALYGGQQ